MTIHHKAKEQGTLILLHIYCVLFTTTFCMGIL